MSTNVPQCALGMTVGGQPTCKNTTFMASSVLLFEPFEEVMCNHESHGTLTGRLGATEETTFAQVWPRAMCQRICIGIMPLLRQGRGVGLVHSSDSFPVGVGKRSAGRPRTPRGVVYSKFGVGHDCPACIVMRHEAHPAHTRNGAPTRTLQTLSARSREIVLRCLLQGSPCYRS